MNVLILTNHIKSFGGSEIQAYEVYSYFKSRGDQVNVYANLFDLPMLAFFDEKDVIYDVELINVIEFDFIWSQHSIFSRLFKEKTIESISVKVVSVHLSPFEPLELSSLPYMSKLDVTFVTNSEETKNRLLDFNINSENIIVSNNAAPDEYIQKRARKLLKKITIISNHPPKEIFGAASLLKKRGYFVEIIGGPRPKKVTPDLIANSDVIISIGKSVQYALLSNTPIYCYDHFGGPGYLNTENFSKAKYFNFSGRGFSRKDANTIASEVIDGFDDCMEFVANMSIDDKRPFRLSVFMSSLLSKVSLTELSQKDIQSIRMSYPIEEKISEYYKLNEKLALSINTKKKRFKLNLFNIKLKRSKKH